MATHENYNAPINHRNSYQPYSNYNDMYREDMYNDNIEDLRYRNRYRGGYYNNNNYYNNSGWVPGCDRFGRCGNPIWWMFWPFFFL